VIRVFRIGAFITAFLAITVSYAFSFNGPFQVKNLFPIFLHAGQPYLEKAEEENSLSLSLSHSSTYTVQESGDWIIHLDMEITEASLRYKRICSDLFELDIDIPVMIVGGGFMDGFLDDYHTTFGFDDYGRSNRPDNELLYEVRKDGRLLVQGRSRTSIGDIKLGLKKTFFRNERLTAAARAEMELPTGDADEGFGNGSIDTGFSILLDAAITGRIMTYWNMGAVFPGDLEAHDSLNLKNFFYAGAAVEAAVTESLSLIAQIEAQTPVYPETDLRAVDRDAVLLVIGGRYSGPNQSIDLSLTEDVNTSGVPDFIVNLTYKVGI
jgi:hypothetical protein